MQTSPKTPMPSREARIVFTREVKDAANHAIAQLVDIAPDDGIAVRDVICELMLAIADAQDKSIGRA